ncbi:hypothetical protein HMPREF1152_1213 [Mogibacterium sp. CM50]|nr:hypothetical protein HMPREF1152_1213 [Mogibacterium sp. CM50]
MLPLQKQKITAFTISYLILISTIYLLYLCKILLSARVFTAHQGFFLKSSKLVVNSTCSLANILVFQRV